jgi:DNA polymerase III delta subunit
MLYVFHGPDTTSGLKKARTLIDSLRAKKPDAAYETIDADHWNSSILEGHLGGQGLFSNKYIVFLNRVTENAEAKEQLGDFAEAMNESSNIFIVLEGKVLADLKKKFEKYAEKVVENELKEVKGAEGVFKREEFKVFSLADALGARDSFKIWSLYRQAVDSGIEPEGILGTLFWQVKSMIVAAKASGASESGLNPFVYGKSKRYAANYSEEELRNLLDKIITLYHDGHRGLTDLELGIEQMLLTRQK